MKEPGFNDHTTINKYTCVDTLVSGAACFGDKFAFCAAISKMVDDLCRLSARSSKFLRLVLPESLLYKGTHDVQST